MNYNWDWGVFLKSTGIGKEIYLDWYLTGLGWTIAIAVAAWIIALLLGSVMCCISARCLMSRRPASPVLTATRSVRSS